MEEEAGEYVNSVHVEGVEPVQEYSYDEHLRQDSDPELEPELEPEPEQESKPEANRLEEETAFEETSHVLQNSLTAVHEPQISVEEPIGKPEKFTYASIVRFILVFKKNKNHWCLATIKEYSFDFDVSGPLNLCFLQA